MGPVTFEHAGRDVRIQASSFLHSGTWPPDRLANGTWRVVSEADRFSVRSLLRDFVSGDHDWRQLREFIETAGGTSATRLSNEQAIDTVAEMIAARRLIVLEKSRDGDSNRRQLMKVATVKYSPSEPASTPSQLRQQPSLADAPHVPELPTAIEESFVADADHDLQAGVLKAAAANGVPICEVCEKAKQAKKAALNAQLAAAD